MAMTHRESSVVDRITDLPIFAGCSRRQLQAIARLALEIDVDAGKVLTKEGEPGREFLIILAGSAVASHDGREVAIFGPGDCFGEIALLASGVRTATVVARSPMRVAVVASHDFDRLLEAVPVLAQRVMQTMAHRLRQTD
ncbi:MAG: hypothetical protein QOG80_788 [Pseudonocardiales bacterium]|nr:hypothetical protein [Pseudonocardiales bacterium]